jgi:hypothetical protein
LNHTIYKKSTAICKVHNVALRYIKNWIGGPRWRLGRSERAECEGLKH